MGGETDNRPEYHESLVMPEGMGKVEYAKDPKVPNAGTFRLNREDHTLGNLIRERLLRDPDVIFAGYQVPHPLEHHVLIKVQAKREDGGVEHATPHTCFVKAVRDLIADLKHLRENFRGELATQGIDPPQGMLETNHVP